jgi:hypothetical protein
VRLHVSVANLAEALQHARAYAEDTGIDLVAMLAAFQVTITSPDVEIARRVAHLGPTSDASLADRFALATTQALGARLHTTDRVLAALARRLGIAVTVY